MAAALATASASAGAAAALVADVAAPAAAAVAVVAEATGGWGCPGLRLWRKRWLCLVVGRPVLAGMTLVLAAPGPAEADQVLGETDL